MGCFENHFNFGLVNPPEWDSSAEGIILSAATFNFTYILLINLFVASIISGIIIDTFGELRSEDETRKYDDRNSCLICSLKREDFERVGESYNDHILYEHKPDSYIWVKLYLTRKRKDELNGIESYLWN